MTLPYDDDYQMDPRVLAAVRRQRLRDIATYGYRKPMAPETWLTVLTEEVGEVAQAILQARFQDGDPQAIAAELAQVLAVGVAWMEQMEYDGTPRSGWDEPLQ